jgi:DNA repair exonuclease SbcCD ATPase subunit
VEQFVKRA